MITIIKAETLASIQDLGRYGWRRLGIGHAGAMDTLALRAGNILLGNDEGAAAMEIVLGSITIRFDCDTSFCLTGAVYEATLDGNAIHSYWRYFARKGQVLHLVRAVQGMYGYLCVRGGFDLPKVLHSRSTDIKAQFGGFQGRALQMGDSLPTGADGMEQSLIGIAPIPFTRMIHALPSTEYDTFHKAAHYRLWQNEWTLQSDSNRMGYRFSGMELKQHKPTEMLSHAVSFGTIQVPPNGQPIILMADTQTTGGYPKIAQIIQADLGKLAQTRFGQSIFIRMATPQQAAWLQQKNEAYLNQIKRIFINH